MVASPIRGFVASEGLKEVVEGKSGIANLKS